MRDIAKLVEADLIANYERYYRLAFSYVRNEADALDVVQEGAYRAVKNCKKIRQAEYITTWIYRIMINEALKVIKHSKRIAQLSDEYEEGASDTYDDQDLGKAIEKLEETDQAIIRLRFFEDLPLRQIAEILETNENTVKSRLYRALGKLKINLEDMGYGKEFITAESGI